MDNEPLQDDYLVTVCSACLQASCWHGEFMCDEAYTAGVKELRASELCFLSREHPDHYSRVKLLRVTGVEPQKV